MIYILGFVRGCCAGDNKNLHPVSLRLSVCPAGRNCIEEILSFVKINEGKTGTDINIIMDKFWKVSIIMDTFVETVFSAVLPSTLITTRNRSNW
jgi:hypothetical protein